MSNQSLTPSPVFFNSHIVYFISRNLIFLKKCSLSLVNFLDKWNIITVNVLKSFFPSSSTHASLVWFWLTGCFPWCGSCFLTSLHARLTECPIFWKLPGQNLFLRSPTLSWTLFEDRVKLFEKSLILLWLDFMIWKIALEQFSVWG